MLSPTSHSPLASGVSEPEIFIKALVKSFYPKDSQKKERKKKKEKKKAGTGYLKASLRNSEEEVGFNQLPSD